MSKIDGVGRQRPGDSGSDSDRDLLATQPTVFAPGEDRLSMKELRALSPQELEETLSYMIGVYPYTLQTVADVAKRLEILSVYGLPDDYYDTYLERLGAITREDLLEAAQEHLHPDRIAIVAVGPADVLVPQLEGVGEVTVHRREPEMAAV